MKIRTNDDKMWARVKKMNERYGYGYLILFGRVGYGRTKGHFEIHLPGNNLGTVHSRGYLKEIRRNHGIVFSDPKTKKTRTIKLKVNGDGIISSFEFI